MYKYSDKVGDFIYKKDIKAILKTNKIKTGKKYHEEINRVDKYSEPELDSFFSNRYK